eukprot:gene16931-biopygen7197
MCNCLATFAQGVLVGAFAHSCAVCWRRGSDSSPRRSQLEYSYLGFDPRSNAEFAHLRRLVGSPYGFDPRLPQPAGGTRMSPFLDPRPLSPTFGGDSSRIPPGSAFPALGCHRPPASVLQSSDRRSPPPSSTAANGASAQSGEFERLLRRLRARCHRVERGGGGWNSGGGRTIRQFSESRKEEGRP